MSLPEVSFVNNARSQAYGAPPIPIFQKGQPLNQALERFPGEKGNQGVDTVAVGSCEAQEICWVQISHGGLFTCAAQNHQVHDRLCIAKNFISAEPLF